MTKRRNGICRRISVALTVTLLVGQSHAFVLAEEGAGDTQTQMEASFGESGTDTLGNGSATDGGNTGNAGNSLEQGDHNGGAGDQKPEEGKKPEDNKNDGDQQDGEDGQDKCICGTKCAEGAVNTECPVCAADYAACAGKADDEGNDAPGNSNAGDNDIENDNTENNDLENGGQDNTSDNLEGTTDEPDKCVCETACTEDAVNEDCLVCAADYKACAKNAGEEVNPAEEAVLTAALEDGPSEDEGIATLADEGVESGADVKEFTYNNVKYTIMNNNTVGIFKQSVDDVPDEVVIPAYIDEDGVRYSITLIAFDAFRNCNNLESVTIEGGVERISSYAFADCKNLTSVKMSDSVLDISDGVFSNCENLTSVELSNSITEIKRGTFGSCHSLSQISIPEGVTSIGEFVFSYCVNLSSIKIPEGVTSIGAQAFAGCESLTSVEIPESVTSIGEGAFIQCKKLTHIKIPKDVTSIGAQAFAGCESLTGIEIPEGVTSIEDSTFGNCASLTSVKIPEEVTSIGQNAFIHCKSLKSVKIPDNVISMGGGSFLGCKNLTSVEISNSLTSIEWGMFQDCDSLMTVVIPTSVTNIGPEAFSLCNKLNEIEIPNNMTSIDEKAFYACHDLTIMRIVVPKGEKLQLPKVGELAFESSAPERCIYFYDEAGNELTGTDLEEAKILFYDAAKKDNDSDDSKWYGWALKEPMQFQIRATATEGGLIEPEGAIVVKKDGEQTFTIIPNEGYRIKDVAVDGSDVTADLADTVTRAKAGARYYTFTNVTQNHTIHAEFERDGGDNTTPGGNGGGGTGDNSNLGDEGGNSGDGGNSSSDGGNDAGNTQTAAGTEISSAQAGSNAAGVTIAGASGQTTGANGTATGGKEPKTGDTAYWEVYATLAMVAGLTYLLLYIMEESRGMTELEKEAAMAALIHWGKKGGAFRKCCAMAAIFGLLLYYHAIGKRAGGSVLRDRYLGQAF